MTLRYAGRYAVRTQQQLAVAKRGCNVRVVDPSTAAENLETMAGLACSECLVGPALARVLAPALRLQQEAAEALSTGRFAPVLSLHTSGGVSPLIDTFADALEARLPWRNAGDGDWFFNLQLEGASAVHAAVEGFLQLQAARGHASRCGVAVATASYHGPPTTSYGASAIPRRAQRVPQANQLPPYPAPTVWAQIDVEHADVATQRMRNAFSEWLDMYGRACGVLLIEPQWGSSSASLANTAARVVHTRDAVPRGSCRRGRNHVWAPSARDGRNLCHRSD